jgi:hypothetical protein
MCFVKKNFPADLLYPECCHEFNLLNKELNIHEDFAAIEDTSCCDQDIDDLQDVNHIVDAFDIVLNASIVLDCHEDQIVPFENFKDDEQIDRSTCESFESVANNKGNPQFSDL